MKKIVKVILFALIVIGISYSTFNFFSIELVAGSSNGTWVYNGEDKICSDIGTDCNIN